MPNIIQKILNAIKQFILKRIDIVIIILLALFWWLIYGQDLLKKASDAATITITEGPEINSKKVYDDAESVAVAEEAIARANALTTTPP